MLPLLPFQCPRTCRVCERVDLCRFQALFATIGGRAQVNSHTVTIRAEYRSMEALEAAVLKQGGQWFGEGEFEFELFEGQRKHRGHGFQLQGWRYPCVLQADGTLAFDHYHGVWGDPALLEDRLPADYIIEAARVAAAAQGWLAEDTAEGLVVHHPDGGTLTITGSGLEAAGFLGGSCHAATDVLTELMGAEGERMLKPEALQQAQQVEVTA